VHIRVVLAAMALLAVMGSGCSGTPEPPYGTLGPTPSAGSGSATTSTSPRPTLSPPAMPAVAREDSARGAEAFARFYLVAQDHANRTGDTRLLRSLGHCAGCAATASGIERFYRAGGRVEGGEIRTKSSLVVSYVPRKAALVEVEYSQASGRLIEGSGQIRSTPAAPKLRVLATVARQGERWTLTKIKPIEGG
jgi:Family of unknown function (DUF6318)